VLARRQKFSSAVAVLTATLPRERASVPLAGCCGCTGGCGGTGGSEGTGGIAANAARSLGPGGSDALHSNRAGVAEVLKELERLEFCLFYERRARGQMQEKFRHEMITQQEIHDRDVAELEQMLEHIMEQKDEMASRIAAWEAQKLDVGIQEQMKPYSHLVNSPQESTRDGWSDSQSSIGGFNEASAPIPAQDCAREASSSSEHPKEIVASSEPVFFDFVGAQGNDTFVSSRGSSVASVLADLHATIRQQSCCPTLEAQPVKAIPAGSHFALAHLLKLPELRPAPSQHLAPCTSQDADDFEMVC